MFPYPSGDGLHVGHVLSYTATDILSRYYRLNGYNVLHPQGWDSFGLPAENYAIKTGVHPQKSTASNIKKFKSQMNSLGLSYDWSREINTSSPEYYKWTQWLFLILYEKGLAYKKKGRVNWCTSCKTVLANEQVVNGECERCKASVIQKDLEQWYFKITDFIEGDGKTSGLLDGLDALDWPYHIKTSQRNWIGKSEGSIVKFKISELDSDIKIFTTRIDTIFGATNLVLSPENEILAELSKHITNWIDVEKYINTSKKLSDLERMENRDRDGIILLGITANNPVNGEKLPIYVASYVLGSYGTGAIMSVPAHDIRDNEFAKKYNINIKEVVRPNIDKNTPTKANKNSDVFTGDGILINSDKYSGITSEIARKKITAEYGQTKTNYKMRDWLVSRQRYWGAPIPIVYCEKCGEQPVPLSDLPILLPNDVDFKPTGESPLVNSKKFQKVFCPKCGEKAKRESDTMDTFVCSSWYYLRYADPENNKEFTSAQKIKKILPVDIYIGGAEHAVLHLLYARFFTKVLCRLGIVSFDEPFLSLRNQGMVLSSDGRKMSKSLGNVINPDDVIKRYGADTLRMHEMFMGPFSQNVVWSDESIIGPRRFLEKVWKCSQKLATKHKYSHATAEILNKTIEKVTTTMSNFNFNTAISSMMILLNAMDAEDKILINDYKKLLIILFPFAPHITSELWENVENKKSITNEKWPKYNIIESTTYTIAIQINGKMRGKVTTNTADEVSVMLAVKNDQNISKWLEQDKIKKTIYITGRILNILV